MTANFWQDEYKNMMKNSDPSKDYLQKILQLCLNWLSDTESREEKMQLLSMTLQLRASIAILIKIDELKEEIRASGRL